MNRKVFAKRDIIIIAIVLSLGFGVLAIRHFLTPEGIGVYAQITSRYGTETFFLDENTTFSTLNMPNVIFEVSDGRIAFIHSDCPDQVCIHAGWLIHPGQTAACLPNQIILFLRSKDPEDDSPDI